MEKSGGIIALIAGIFGTGAAIVTLLVGGLGSAVGAKGGSTVIGLGWGGVFFSFATLVLGAIAMGSNAKWVGKALIATSLLGAFLGGTLVAVFMVLALAGGIMAIVGNKTNQAEAK